MSIYPFSSGSQVTASYAVSSSYSNTARYIRSVTSASKADTVLLPESGSLGKSVCVLTYAQYLLMVNSGSVELCVFE